MFGKNRTAPVPAHGKYSLSLKTEKASEPLEGFIPDNAGRVRISDEVLDSIVDQAEAHMLKRSKGKQNAKQPHVRIEFDDIADTPKVFIDGVDVTDWKRNGKALVALHLDWITDDEQPQPKSFKLKTIEQNGYHIFNCKYNTTGR